eukprot:gene9937-5147_t
MSSADNTAGAASPALGGGASGWREATKLIREIGLKMSLPTTVVCTSLALYHRFIAGPASDQLDLGLVAMAVVYLASKAEENPRDLRDVITVGHNCLRPEEAPLRVGSFYRELRESVIACELLVLRGVGFDLVVAHPHRHLLHFATLLEQDLNSNSGGSGSGRREGVGATPWFVDRVGNRVESGGGAGSSSSAAQKSVTKLLRDAVNVAWQLLTDSYHTRLPLEASPPHLAVVALWVAVEAQGIAATVGMEKAARGERLKATYYSELLPDPAASSVAT